MLNYNYLKKLKKKKKTHIQNIQNSNKYFYFCKYTDLTFHEIINLKTLFKTNDIQFYFVKNKLFNHSYNLKGKGTLLVLHFSDFNNYYKINEVLKKFDNIIPLFFFNKKKIYSNFKLQNLRKPKILTIIFKNILNLININLLQIKP